ncbi:MAG: histidine kinase dimerization/phospho-acceptor domain-containing protein [Chloroflexota bacterium]
MDINQRFKPGQPLTAEQCLLLNLAESTIRILSLEVKTPATAIMGYAQLLLQEKFGTLNEEQRKVLTLMEKSTKHQMNMWTDMIETFQVLAHDLVLSIQNVDLREIIKEAMEDIPHSWYPKYEPGTVSIQQSIPDNLPLLEGDPYRLRLAITWLILETLIHERNIKSKIQITADHESEWVTVGLYFDHNEPVLLSFEQSPRLLASRKIIEAHQGIITSNKLDKESSSIFTVKLPVIKNHEPQSLSRGET